MHVENNLRELCPYLQELILPMSRFPPLLREGIPTENLEHLLMLSDSSSEKFDSVSRLRAREQEVTEVVDWILSLPRIRQITLCTRDGLYGNLLFPHIWERCTRQGIELRLQHRRRYINLRIHTEMIPACHFPREEGTAFNMSIMKRLANSEATHPAWSA
ncbi:hypothetical protein FRC03_008119 [Tulasnella sp. 419]|nr:hypothetical protein FRC03_008119 [Tulasnella sp. 419]